MRRSGRACCGDLPSGARRRISAEGWPTGRLCTFVAYCAWCDDRRSPGWSFTVAGAPWSGGCARAPNAVLFSRRPCDACTNGPATRPVRACHSWRCRCGSATPRSGEPANTWRRSAGLLDRSAGAIQLGIGRGMATMPCLLALAQTGRVGRWTAPPGKPARPSGSHGPRRSTAPCRTRRTAPRQCSRFPRRAAPEFTRCTTTGAAIFRRPRAASLGALGASLPLTVT